MRHVRYFLVLAVTASLFACDNLRRQATEPGEIRFNGFLPIVQQGKLGFIDGSGKVVIQPQFDVPASLSLEAEHFSENLEPIEIGGKWGYIGVNGKFIINPQFEWADQFSEGRARIYQDGKWGFIDHSGTPVVPPQFDGARSFKDSRALVRVGDKWGFIGLDGKYVINPQFDGANAFTEHFAGVQVGGKWGLIGEDGKYTINPQFDYIGELLDGLAPVSVGGKFGYVNSDGKLVINPQFPNASTFRSARARAVVGDAVGFIDQAGKFVINPQFQRADDFHDGLAAVSTGGRWGYVGPDGAYTINPQFDWASAFWGGLAQVRQGGKVGFVDTTGHLVLNPEFDDAASQPIGHFRWVRKDNKLGYIDERGHFVWPLTSVIDVDSVSETVQPGASARALGSEGLQAAFQAAAQLQEEARLRQLQQRFLNEIPLRQRSNYTNLRVASIDRQAPGFLSAGQPARMGLLVPSGQPLSVAVRSSEFDTTLQVYLVGPDGERILGGNDDADGSNSRLTLCAGPGGPRVLSIGSFQPGRTGNFVVDVARMGADAPYCASSVPQPVMPSDSSTADTLRTQVP
jgi:hypothetical protein